MRWLWLPAARRALLVLCVAAAGSPALARQEVKDIVTPSIANTPSS
jgi:hypothetical protein